MKINHPLLTKSLALFGATAIRALTATLDYRIVYADPLADPVHPRRSRDAIYLLWHEYLIFPLGVRGKRMRGKQMTVLISLHRDGELITQATSRFPRGSRLQHPRRRARPSEDTKDARSQEPRTKKQESNSKDWFLEFGIWFFRLGSGFDCDAGWSARSAPPYG